MDSLPVVFISYNPKSEVEQTLAIRLHSIGTVHGFNMLLPDRSFGSINMSQETRSRILSSDYFILFSTQNISPVVIEEINTAFSKLKDKSRILVIYDHSMGKNLYGVENCTTVFIDVTQDPQKIVSQIASEIKKVQKSPGSNNDFLSTLGGILLVGIGLFALSEAFSSKARKPERKKAIRKPSLRKV